MKIRATGAKVFLVALWAHAVISRPILAADEAADWPCEQAYVAEVAAAVVWDGPAIDGLEQAWQVEPDVATLVKRLSARRLEQNQAERLIEAFALAQPPERKDRMLTLLFAGVLDTLNQDRKTLLSGILRYSRDQQRRAVILDRKLSEMVELEQDESEAARQLLAERRRVIELEQRSFDDREQSIPYFCSRPRVVEGRIGEIARAISGYLD